MEKQYPIIVRTEETLSHRGHPKQVEGAIWQPEYIAVNGLARYYKNGYQMVCPPDRYRLATKEEIRYFKKYNIENISEIVEEIEILYNIW